MSLLQRTCGVMLMTMVLNKSEKALADITSQTIRPSLNNTYRLLEDASLWQWDLQESEEYKSFYTFQFNTVNLPVVQFDASGNNPTPLVNRTNSVQGGGTWQVSDRLQVGVDVGENFVQNSQGYSYTGLSEARLLVKYGILGRAKSFGISVAPEAYFPFQNTNPFISNGVFGYGGRLIIEKNFSLFQMAVNAGLLKFPGAHYKNVDYSTQIPLSVGAYMPLARRVALNLEGTTTALSAKNINGGPGDLYLGVRTKIFSGGYVTVGASASPISENGTTSMRFLAGFNILPHAKPDEVKVINQTTIKKIQTTRDCSPKTQNLKFEGRQLNESELAELSTLPYASSSGQRIATLNLGQKTGLTPDGRTYVKDAQTLFAIDLKGLPVQSTVVSIDKTVLKMKVNKLLHDSVETTNLLCILNDRICSGNLYSEKLREKNVNGKFFRGKETPNDFFMKSYHHDIAEKGRKFQILTAELELPLARLIENSTLGGVFGVIYDHPPEGTTPVEKILYFAAALDVYVYTKVELQIDLKVVTCDETEKESSVETRVEGVLP